MLVDAGGLSGRLCEFPPKWGDISVREQTSQVVITEVICVECWLLYSNQSSWLSCPANKHLHFPVCGTVKCKVKYSYLTVD